MTGMDASDWRRMVIHLHLKVSARQAMARLAAAGAAMEAGREGGSVASRCMAIRGRWKAFLRDAWALDSAIGQ